MKLKLDALANAVESAIAHAVEEIGTARSLSHCRPFNRNSPLDGDDIGLSSFELIAAATDIADRFDLRRHGLEDYLLRRRSLTQWADIINDSLEADSTLLFHSSGSMDKPKACPHQLAMLAEEAASLLPHIGAPQRIRLMVPAHHIYGFIWGVILPSILDIPVISRVDAPQLFSPGDLIVSYPEHWDFLSRSNESLPDDIVGLCSTAPLNVDTAQRLKDRKLRHLIEIYGSSETAGVGWRNQHGTPYTLLPHWQDLTVGKEEVTLVHRSGQRKAALQDYIQVVGRRSFEVGKRRDEAIQVSGMNVYPRQIQTVLESCSLVASARVRPDRETGGLAALIIPQANVPLDESTRHELAQEIRAWCRGVLKPYERPMRFDVRTEIPTSDMGKEKRWCA